MINFAIHVLNIFKVSLIHYTCRYTIIIDIWNWAWQITQIFLSTYMLVILISQINDGQHVRLQIIQIDSSNSCVYHLPHILLKTLLIKLVLKYYSLWSRIPFTIIMISIASQYFRIITKFSNWQSFYLFKWIYLQLILT